MYAIETKKRKFDRLLDSMSRSPTTLHAQNRNASTSTLSLKPADAASATAKKAKTTAASDLRSASSTSGNSTASFLPSDRQAFLTRLETFGPVTKWHIPSNEEMNATTWAKRGWQCVGTDMVACAFCKEQLLVKIEEEPLEDPPGSVLEDDSGFDLAMEIHAGIVAKYKELVVNAHQDQCPWRRRGCDDSIQRINGLLNISTALSSLQERYESLTDTLDGLGTPHVHLEGADDMELTDFTFSENAPRLQYDALLLAICGWQKGSVGRGDDVIECRHCFRSLGLWLYRGDEPAMEKLDAVESHLEYCPWRSPDAQDTQIESCGQKERIPGWALVMRQIAKRVLRSKSELKVGPTAVLEIQQEVEVEAEREKKMAALLRRVKELKKPFNVKALLKKSKKM